MTGYAMLLVVHIAAGSLSTLAGIAALVFRKGGRAHRTAGTVFVAAMIVMGASAAILGMDFGNAFAGGLTIYFVTTAWVAGRRSDNQAGLFEIAAFVVALVVCIGCLAGTATLVMGLRAPDNPFIIPVSFLISGALMLAAAGDLNVVLRHGLSGGQRIARHLWRMCFALFIAAGSFTAQGAQALPAGLPRQQLLLGAMILVLVVMLFWLARVFIGGWPPAAGRKAVASHRSEGV